MKVFVIGGTGLVGSYLIPGLIEKKHTVYVLTRNAEKLSKIGLLGATGIIGDITRPESFQESLPEKPDIIVLLAMPAVKPGQRITRKRKEELYSDTTAFFRNTMDMASRFDIPAILPGGTGYRTKEGEIADETWPIRRVGITEIGKDTDHMVEEAVKTGNPKVVQLIYGKIYGNGGLFRAMYEMMQKGRMKIIGSGRNCIPNTHAVDAANAIVKAIEKLPVGQKFIIADDTPVTQGEFTRYMAELLGKKKPGRIPGFIVRMVIGKDLFEVISMNCKVSNAKAKQLLEWKPEYPSFREGLKAVIDDMKTNAPLFGK
jgi:nucleoside-diphosphate-sugar epimerase